MYKKYFSNFEFKYSNKPRTRRKQEARFKGHCKRVFNIGKPNACHTLEDHLKAGKHRRFLFLDTQSIEKPIQHLKYSKKTHCNNENDYKFEVPFSTSQLKWKNDLDH